MSAQKNIYINFSEIDGVQTEIMRHVDSWVHKEKTPIPFKKIIENMEAAGTKKGTTMKAIYVLIKKGYIRRSYQISSKANAAFVQLRRV